MVMISYWVNPTSEMRPMLMAAYRWLGGCIDTDRTQARDLANRDIVGY